MFFFVCSVCYGQFTLFNYQYLILLKQLGCRDFLIKICISFSPIALAASATVNLLHAEVSYIIDTTCHWTFFQILQLPIFDF